MNETSTTPPPVPDNDPTTALPSPDAQPTVTLPGAQAASQPDPSAAAQPGVTAPAPQPTYAGAAAAGASYPPPAASYQPPAGYLPPAASYPPPGAYPPPTYQPPAPAYPPAGYGPERRLLRSRSDRMLGGVCGGLARYWNTDPTLLRILTIVLTLVTGGAFLLGYLIAWIAIPDEPTGPAPLGAGGQAGYAAGGNPPYGDQAAFTAAPPARERSYLGWLIVSAAVLVAGVLGIFGALLPATASAPGIIGGVILAILGVGLLVGARYGRARWLVVLAVPVAMLTFGAVAAGAFVQSNPNWDRWTVTGGSGQLEIGDRTWAPTPTDVSGAPLDYRVSAGDAVLDLTGLTALGDAEPGAPRQRVSINASVGVGQLRVLVPDDMLLELSSTVDVGEIQVPGEPVLSGTKLVKDTTLEPSADGAPAYIVTLDAALGAGNLEVQQ